MDQQQMSDVLGQFFPAAAAIVDEGVAFARQDDPHRFNALKGEFDGGKAVPCLVVEGFGLPEQRIAVRFVGARDGQEKVVEVFSFSVRMPQMQ